GPPYEAFDISPSIPQRSYLKWSTSTNYAPSPGDNLIRAVGQYNADYEDAGIDAVWNGDGFFIYENDSIQISCAVFNCGDTGPVNCNVGCYFYTESGSAYTFFDSLATQTVTVALAETTVVTFDPYIIGVEDRYRIDAFVSLEGDFNHENDTLSTETQVYTLPAELRYDDGSPDGSDYSSNSGEGWGMRFDPNCSDSWRLQSVKVHTNATVGDLPARVKIFDDANGEPGDLIYETVQMMSNGWNDILVDVNPQGPFFVFYYFEYGASTSALSYDDSLPSAQVWIYDPASGTFSQATNQDDYVIRANLVSGGEVWWIVDLNYISGSPVPSTGGDLNCDVYVENISGVAEDLDVWLEAIYYNNLSVTVAQRSFNNFQPGWALSRNLSLPIPANWPAGGYDLELCIGVYPDNIWESDDFPFIKEGVIDQNHPDELQYGQPLSLFDMENGKSEPKTENHDPLTITPNPFNPTTAISIQLSAFSHVNLSVYDIAGRKVATLIDGWRNAGSHEAVFDGSGLASGIYIAMLKMGDEQQSQKITLLK
ncbi:T9SS type A sorting domain-containing protein, partial [bacterium]|nr:T9SS type A sorting domain-containing protein [bacterium]